MSLSRVGRWAVWVSSCALAAVTMVIAVKSLPLKSAPRAAKHAPREAAAIARPPRAPRSQPPQPMMVKADRLPHHIAYGTLRLNGIRMRSSGHCTDRHNPTCTSLEGIRRGTIEGLLAFQRQSRCRIVVTGGTEAGHARGRYSHGNGYKIDIVPSRCVDRHITKRFRPAGARGDGAGLYHSPSGNLYANENTHWDILYK